MEAAGVAFAITYAVYLPLVFAAAWLRIGFPWTRRVFLDFGLVASLAAGVFLVSEINDGWGVLAGLSAAIILAVRSLLRLQPMLGRRIRTWVRL